MPISRSHLEALYSELAANMVDVLVVDFLSGKTPQDKASYDALFEKINSWILTKPDAGLRVKIVEADGAVALDTSKKDKNTFDNFNKKLINENTGARGYVIGAVFSASGTMHQSKYSNSVKANQSYYAVRVGPSPNDPYAIIVISTNA
jgi:hypothetical protein